jgi:curli biogenesis system outer membrane secretion channel CsgG
MHQMRLAPGEQPIVVGAAVRENRTPMDAPLACFGSALLAGKGKAPVIAVGDVRDYTGKYSVNEGNAITQGGALMVTSALGKLGGAVRLAERFDPTIAERELGYADRRQLGDGMAHMVAGANGPGQVPWLPYYGGSIAASDYYIVGGITELNYDIRSGGIEAAVNQLGPKARIYTQSVAIDLRIVDTRSLLVIRTVSLTKQFIGYEVGFNLFRFFGSDLFDIGLGAKGQEPLQLGIRTALEEATLRLVGTVTHVDPTACLARQSWTAPGGDTVERALTSPAPQPAHGVAINALPGAEARSGGSAARLLFEPGSAELSGAATATLSHIVAERTAGPVDVAIVARDTETLDPAARQALVGQRIAALRTALVARGVPPAALTISWRAEPTDAAVHADSAGLQIIARLHIG